MYVIRETYQKLSMTQKTDRVFFVFHAILEQISRVPRNDGSPGAGNEVGARP